MTAVKLGLTYSFFNDADRIAVGSAVDGTKFVDENKNVWTRNREAFEGFDLTVGRGDGPPALLKVIAIPGVEPVAGE